MRRAYPVVVVLAGTAATVLLSWHYGMGTSASVQLAAIAAGTALAAGVAGALLLVAVRRRPLSVQLVVMFMTVVGAVGAGATTSAGAMFISEHDLHTLFVVLVASGTVGTVFAFLFGDRIDRASRSLQQATDSIAAGHVYVDEGGEPAPEIAGLRRRLEDMSRSLDAARERERSIDSSRRELVAWVSHDLRTPLAGIRAMIEALEDGVVADPETVRRYHRTIGRETERLAALVDDLFELSRINSGTLMLELERVSLGDLISDAVSAARPAAKLRGVHLEGELTSEDLSVELSIPEMNRVIRNLLENAIRHTPPDGTVTVAASADGEEAVLSVADSCGGIPADDIERVFDVAFRGASSRTPDDGGGGLGLAIARGIVEAHRGRITVSNEGSGCRFEVVLPVVAR